MIYYKKIKIKNAKVNQVLIVTIYSTKGSPLTVK
jgi:hypothetical protein